ncbi:MAG: T9SS type A sorting domain-containing protein [Bacteroidetes bacterium]|nr:T9SS type A sorting domain-containing protein [Bacteroidota bacterium]MBK7569107.1 T9SS type A sorting domain-containing protein [Bacteroidota bacterium]
MRRHKSPNLSRSSELFNGIDDNCNDTIDENFVEIFTLNNEPYLNISPNPNTGTFNLHYNAQIGGTSPLKGGPRGVTLQIFNSLGQQIYSQELISSNGNINETISLQNLSSGIYFVKINNVQQKLIIE